MAGDFPRDPSGPVFLEYPKEPGPELHKRMIDFIQACARPENFPGLHPGPIPEDEPFVILGNIDVDKSRRPAGDRVPCAMCTPNRFFTGKLIYVPSFKCVTIIGHCCANKENLERAEQIYDAKVQRDHEEDYLLRALPLVPAKLAAIDAIMPKAEEAAKTQAKFRRQAGHVQAYIRDIKKAGGEMLLEEYLPPEESEEDDDGDTGRVRVGPRGFSGQSDRTVIHRFGILRGLTVSLDHYDPAAELHIVSDCLADCFASPDEDETFYHIADLSDADRKSLVDRLRRADQCYSKFSKRLSDFQAFFDDDNIFHFSTWGSHQLNKRALAIAVSRPARTTPGTKRYVITTRQDHATITIGPQFWLPFPEWDYVDFGK